MIEFYTTVLITRTRPVVQTTPDAAQPRPPRSLGPATVVELQHAGRATTTRWLKTTRPTQAPGWRHQKLAENHLAPINVP